MPSASVARVPKTRLFHALIICATAMTAGSVVGAAVVGCSSNNDAQCEDPDPLYGCYPPIMAQMDMATPELSDLETKHD